MINTKIQEERGKFNSMFEQLKECRSSLEKDDSPIVDIFNSIINVDLIKKSLIEKRTKFLNKKRSENICDFGKLFELIQKDYKAFFNFSEEMSQYLYSENKVLDVTIEPKEFVSLKDIKLIYEFKKDFIPSFKLDKELRDELLILSAKLYLQTHKKKSDYYASDYHPDKYRAQEFFSDLVSDISKLFFIRSLPEKELYFMFNENELKVPTKEDDLFSCGDKLYICDFFEERNKEEDLFYFNKFLLDDKLSKEKLTEVFVDKIKVAIDSRIESIVDINSSIFSLINIELGNVPIDLYTDNQILFQIQKYKKSFDFSTIENIKKITSKEQFERFMKILAEI